MRWYRNNGVMLALSSISLLCLCIELGLWAYAGSPLPQTRGTAIAEKLEMWTVWTIIVVVPSLTALSWLLRFQARR